jgi:hypothetical protein
MRQETILGFRAFDCHPVMLSSEDSRFLRWVVRLFGWRVARRPASRRYRVASPDREARLHRELKERVKRALGTSPGWR